MGKKDFKKLGRDELKEKLTPLQFHVTQEEGTEAPYANEYWNNSEEGIYVDIVSGEPLFSSKDKFDSKCGWPSFTKTINGKKLIEKPDNKISEPRTEIRSPIADSHIGHVFQNWPVQSENQKVTYTTSYCANSAALEFIPASELVARGYNEYVSLFD